MTVTLGGTVLDHIIDWGSRETTMVSTPDFVNTATPTVDEDIWSREPEIIIIVCREDAVDKWAIEVSADALAAVNLVENGDTKSVWILGIRSHYEGYVNRSKPWLMEIELIAVN